MAYRFISLCQLFDLGLHVARFVEISLYGKIIAIFVKVQEFKPYPLTDYEETFDLGFANKITFGNSFGQICSMLSCIQHIIKISCTVQDRVIFIFSHSFSRLILGHLLKFVGVNLFAETNKKILTVDEFKAFSVIERKKKYIDFAAVTEKCHLAIPLARCFQY